MISAEEATTYVVGDLSAYLVSGCQRERERVGVACRVLCVSSFALLSVVELACFGLVVLVRQSLSYGVRHMHSIVPYYLIELMLSYAIYIMLICTILLSVSLFVARYALSIKYRRSVDPSMCVVQFKVLI